MKYPNSRKSPFKHRVRKHTRSGRTVRSYERGQGKEALRRRRYQRISKSNNQMPTQNPRQGEMFNITVEYENRNSDFVTVQSENYANAIDKGMITRNAVTPPRAITLTMVT